AGSTVGMSGAACTDQNAYRYLPFGELLTSSGNTPNAFQFVGQFGVMAQPNGLGFMRARFYSSTQGRFLGPDPLGLAGGQSNLYAYAAQNPLSVIDPTGLECRDLSATYLVIIIQSNEDTINKDLKDIKRAT